MRNEYSFSKAKRGAVIPSPGKTRITIMIDDDILDHFRARADGEGIGYQTLINAALRRELSDAQSGPKVITVDILRRVIREELHSSEL